MIVDINFTFKPRPLPPSISSLLISAASFPSTKSCRASPFLPKHISDTRTAAPSTTQGSSDHASNISPNSEIWSRIPRLDFWRIENGLIRENWVLIDLLDIYNIEDKQTVVYFIKVIDAERGASINEEVNRKQKAAKRKK